MGLGVYILLNVLFYLLVLRFKPEIRRQDRIWTFTGRSIFISFFCSALFTAFSVGLGVMQVGVSQNYNLPQDYLKAGAAGWGVLLIGLAGILSPIWGFVIFISSRKQGSL